MGSRIHPAGVEASVAADAGEVSRCPRITLVTPVWNSAKYIEQTIISVLSQGYPNLEYFIVDGGSTDGSMEIIRRYEKDLAGWISEPDGGMYNALNKGFAQGTGEVMGWISATDMLHPGGLAVTGSVFHDLPAVDWITGHPTGFVAEGMTIVARLPRWSRYRFLAGANRYIQQESTFWRRRLWEKAGGRVDDSRRIAADFELWVRFFRHGQLYTVEALIGGFRDHSDSIGLMDMEACHRVHDDVIEKELASMGGGGWIRAYRRLDRGIQTFWGARFLWRKFLRERLYDVPGPDWPPVIRYGWGRWVLSR